MSNTLCKCGCGQPCKSNYLIGHHWKAKREKNMEPPNLSGLCQCGCGRTTQVATYTSTAIGWVKDQHVRFLYGHHCGPPIVPPNPSGLCMCGCGQPAPIATLSNRRTGALAGHPMRFIHNHHTRKSGAQYVIEDRGYKTPCWIWQLYKDEHGYGKITVDGVGYAAHRHFYTQAKGEIPADYQVDHLCFVPSCVNPDHLEAVTAIENQRRRRFVALSEEKIPTIKLLEVGAFHTARSPRFLVSKQRRSVPYVRG